MAPAPPTLTVAVCTRGRPVQLRATLNALEREAAAADFELVVVRQGETEDRGDDGRVRTIFDTGRGLSRARNILLRHAETDWIAFVDDDCRVEPGFGPALVSEIEAHPEADWLSGHVGAGTRRDSELPLVTTFPVTRERTLSGRWTLPGSIGFGVFFAVRRELADRLGGWDERLGPGAELPAADDMDFAFRLLRAGGVAVLSPRVRAVHDQWRTLGELRVLQRGYLCAWSAFAMKHLRGGDVRGGLWLWAWGVVDVLDMAKSALGRRSRLRAGLTAAKLAGLVEGTVAGLRRSW